MSHPINFAVQNESSTPDLAEERAKWPLILCLVIAGEAVFSLPFHVARYFRPTVLEVFRLTNTELGDIFAMYGICAMLAYFPGGAIADRFGARKLLSLSLFATAFGGFYMIRIPGPGGLSMLFGYWGITTILLSWSALIRATRDYAGLYNQGRAFGILDGGRGLVAALAAAFAVWLFGLNLPAEPLIETASHQRLALQSVIFFYTLFTFGTGLVIWFALPDASEASGSALNFFKDMKQVIGKPVVWLQAAIVICAYCGYKGLDYYSQYAVDVLEMNPLESARFTALLAFLRPIAAIGAGFLADRWSSGKIILSGFLLCMLGDGLLAAEGSLNPLKVLVYANLLMTCVAVFGIRGVYFALLEESKIDRGSTGSAVGLISLAGFTPDIFFVSLSGRLLDANSVLHGYQHLFALLTMIAFLGMLATLLLARQQRR